jgi:hypothetical protein
MSSLPRSFPFPSSSSSLPSSPPPPPPPPSLSFSRHDFVHRTSLASHTHSTDTLTKTGEELWREYERVGQERGEEEEEVVSASVDTAIGEENVGYRMMLAMGWGRGGLGKREEGRKDPIPLTFREKRDFLGVGKHEEYTQQAADATEHRRLLEQEREETEALQRLREEKAKRDEEVHSVVRAMVRPFYCELCDKQYKNVAEYDKHLNSYDHNHKARFLETKKRMRQSVLKADAKKEEKRNAKRLRLEKEALCALPTPPPPPPSSSSSSSSLSSPSPPPPPPPEMPQVLSSSTSLNVHCLI